MVKSILAYLNVTGGLVLNVRAIFVVPAPEVSVVEALPGAPEASIGLPGSFDDAVVGLLVAVFEPEEGIPETLQPANASAATNERLRRANLNILVKRMVFIAFPFYTNEK